MQFTRMTPWNFIAHNYASHLPKWSFSIFLHFFIISQIVGLCILNWLKKSPSPMVLKVSSIYSLFIDLKFYITIHSDFHQFMCHFELSYVLNCMLLCNLNIILMHIIYMYIHLIHRCVSILILTFFFQPCHHFRSLLNSSMVGFVITIQLYTTTNFRNTAMSKGTSATTTKAAKVPIALMSKFYIPSLKCGCIDHWTHAARISRMC